jgi:hypothetical protein
VISLRLKPVHRAIATDSALRTITTPIGTTAAAVAEIGIMTAVVRTTIAASAVAMETEATATGAALRIMIEASRPVIQTAGIIAAVEAIVTFIMPTTIATIIGITGIGMATGADLGAIVPGAGTGEWAGA